MLEAGDRFGDYVILKRLSGGGMAEVYLARKAGVEGFTKPVAVKVILPHLTQNEKFIKMFLSEARLAVSLNHANIAQILDLGEHEGQYFISMEFAHGQDLQQISKKTRKSGRLLPLPYAAKVISQIAEGLYYAHTKTNTEGVPLEIVHRDVSPHNIVLTFEGISKLVDFGVAKAAVTYKEEEQGILKGKFSYMSPEQIRGMPVDPRSDIFALGIVLWEICTGAHLFRESSELLTMEAILRKPVPKPRELRGDMPPDLEAIILKALAKRSVDRFQTASEMTIALERYLSRSGWNVGTPHLGEFMKKLFPDEFVDIRELLERERRIVEAEQRSPSEEFVPWEPYQSADGDPPGSPTASLDSDPVTDPSLRPVSQPEMEISQPPMQRSRSWLSILLVFLLLVLLGVGVVIIWKLFQKPSASLPPANSQTVVRGVLQVNSSPPGGQIYVNAKPRGKTPARLTDLPLDVELTVRVRLTGHQDYVQALKLSSRRPQESIQAKLEKR